MSRAQNVKFEEIRVDLYFDMGLQSFLKYTAMSRTLCLPLDYMRSSEFIWNIFLYEAHVYFDKDKRESPFLTNRHYCSIPDTDALN